MKKILVVLIFVLVLIPFKVYASSTFYEDNYLPDAYIKKFKNGSSTGKYEQMRMFKRSDGESSYCLELWEDINSNIYLEEKDSNYAYYSNLSQEVWNRVELIAYYGYGYKDHTDLSWYTASQFLIWKTIDNDSNIYFTDTLNGKKTDKFTYEINEIERLISNHYIMPSFSNKTYNINIGESISFENSWRNEWTVYGKQDILSMSHYNGMFTINGNKVGSTELKLIKSAGNSNSLLYISPNSQNMLIRGSYTPITSSFFINVVGGLVNVNLYDIDTKKFEIDMFGTKYGLYDKDKNLIEEKFINSDGSLFFDYVPYGKYYIKEIYVNNNYNLDNNYYEVNLNSDNSNITLDLCNKKIESKIIINNKLKDISGRLINAVGNSFSIYDSNNIEIDNIIIDNNGIGNIVLPYGTYMIKQNICIDDYQEIEEFYIDVINNDDIRLDLVNEQFSHELLIENIDSESFKNINMSEATYRIKDKQNNFYLDDNNNSYFQTKNGLLEFPIRLANGNYLLEETTSFNGYYKISNYDLIIDNNNMSKINLVLENDKINGTINVKKLGEYNGTFIDLENVSFSLYASEDIISSDGVVHYKKDELVKELITDFNGKCSFSNLLYGKYYIIENKIPDNYIKDTNKYYFDISDGNLEYNFELKNYLKKGNIKVVSNCLINGKYILYDHSMNKINEYKSFNGEINVYDLPIGKYYIKQISVDDGYILNNEVLEANIINNLDEVIINISNSKELVLDSVPKTLDTIKSDIIYSFIGLIGITFTGLFLKKKNN